LKQSGKNWNELFTDVLKGSDFKFNQLGEDTCLFTRLVDDQITLLFIYVDDIYIASSDPSYLEQFKKDLSAHFELKVLGVPQKLLGIQLQWAKDFEAVHLRAEQLIDELIKEHKIDVSTPEPTPMRADYRPRKADAPTEEERKTKQFKDLTLRYQQIVGSFIFISNTCRPDISYATNQLCRRMSCPNHADLEAAHHLVRYLAGTKDMGIGYRATGNRKPYFYADSDDGSDETRRSCAGYLAFLADGPIYWRSGMVDSLSLSSCESEIRAINMAMDPIKEALHLQHLLHEIEENLQLNRHLPQYDIMTSIPIEILEDNSACIDWSKHRTNSTKMRHLERDLKWIQQYVAAKLIRLVHIPTGNQIADMMTKALQPQQFIYLRDKYLFRFLYPE
jgi:hypothetical protein